MEVKDMSSKNKKSFSKVKTWCKKHKAELIGYGVILGTAVVGIVIGVVGANSKNGDHGPSVTAGLMPEVPEHDYGRNLVMKFFDEETGEPYKEDGIGCTEEYAKDMYDCF